MHNWRYILSNFLVFFRKYFIEASSFSAFDFFQYYVKFLFYKLSKFDVLLAINNFLIVLSATSGGFPRRLMKCSLYLCILPSWQAALILLSRCSSFNSLHLLSVMLIMIVYLLASFWFYWFGLECLLVVLFGMYWLVVSKVS